MGDRQELNRLKKLLIRILSRGTSVFSSNGGMRGASREYDDIQRLLNLPGRTPCVSSLLGVPMRVNDAPLFVSTCEQTFRKGVINRKDPRQDVFAFRE